MRSKVTDDGYMEVSIIEVPLPKPQENEVLVRMEAAPINPSDLGKILSHAADLSDIKTSGKGQNTNTKIKLKAKLMAPLQPRLNQLISLGNEGAGVVVDAGSGVKEMLGKTVGLAGGGMYSQYQCIPANNCLIMNKETTPPKKRPLHL